MRAAIGLILAVAIAGVPGIAQAGGFNVMDDAAQYRWPFPAPPRPPRVSLPAPIPVVLTEAEWGRWLLRARERQRHCGRIAFISGVVAASGLALLADRDPTPSPEELAAGRTGKVETFVFALGAASVAGGGLTFLGAGQCASRSAALVTHLEWEGRRRSYGPPTAPPMSEAEWMTRLANARGQAAFARRVALAGTMAMLVGGSAIERYQPHPEQRGLGRLGSGAVIFFVGLGATTGGLVAWAHGAADARALETQAPAPTLAFRLAPKRGGVAARVVIGF